MKNNFSRSNVNEETLDIKSPLRSSFNLSHSSHLSLPLGKLIPVNFEPLLPTDVLQGSLNPKFQMEKIMTPSMGRTRLDTHTFVVNARRVNRDFVTLRGDNTGSKPNFDVYELYGMILGTIVTVGSGHDFSDIDTNENLSSYLTVSVGTGLNTVANRLITVSKSFYQTMLNTSTGFGNDADTYGFMRDFYAEELQRLEALPSYSGAQNVDAIPNAIFEVLRPYASVGSIMDMLGYPILTPYGSWYSIAKSIIQADNDNPEAVLTSAGNWLTMFHITGFHIDEVEGGEQVVVDFSEVPRKVDETPLRVVYAVWYDYFRNYHVEKRANFLDPDLFGSSALIIPSQIYSVEQFQQWLQLILPHYRMFARDYLTTVQTEDKFRFVYSPIKTTSTSPDALGELNALDIDDDFYNQITKLGLPKLATANANMPLPFFTQLNISDSEQEYTVTNILRNDLQTMRRSGMLEKWLARNYFYPDTYVGQLLARYQVTPSDVAIINAEYIGGNEAFLSDEQITANVTTSDTPMGQRVLKADVGLTDNFTYAATDYCYMVSFASLMPLVSYDSPNMHLHEITSVDFPDPEFAEDTRVAIRTCDLLRGFDQSKSVIGYVPRYYQYRIHPDETHGRYLTDYRAYNWFRDWYNMNFTDFTVDDKYYPSGKVYERDFTLNPYSLRVHLVPDAFLGANIWDSIAFGKIDIQCHIQRPIPAAVEFI